MPHSIRGAAQFRRIARRPPLLRSSFTWQYMFGDSGTGAQVTHEIDPDDWSAPSGAPTFTLRVHGITSTVARPFTARLYNVTDGAPVAGSAVQVAATVEEAAESNHFSLASGARTYRVEFGGVSGETYTAYQADLKVWAV